jgi:hypothetical protein
VAISTEYVIARLPQDSRGNLKRTQREIASPATGGLAMTPGIAIAKPQSGRGNLFFTQQIDCFASLAMTGKGHHNDEIASSLRSSQ